MIFGSLHGAGLGSPDNHLELLDVVSLRSGTAFGVTAKAASGWGNAWYGIYLNSKLSETVYLAEGVTSPQIAISAERVTGKSSIIVLRLSRIGRILSGWNVVFI